MHLMRCPCFHNISCLIRFRKICCFYYMSQLKYKSHHQSFCYVHCQITDQKLPPCEIKHQQRNHYKGDIVYCFEKEEVEVFYFRMLIKPIAHLFLKKLHIIFSKKPGERSQTIKKEGI